LIKVLLSLSITAILLSVSLRILIELFITLIVIPGDLLPWTRSILLLLVGESREVCVLIIPNLSRSLLITLVLELRIPICILIWSLIFWPNALISLV